MFKFILYRSCFLLLMYLPFYGVVHGQELQPARQIGTSFITNFYASKNGFERQTWSISTCSNGLTYFANQGLLVGGNRFWKTYSDERIDSPRSVYALSPDSLLIGSKNEIGLFVRNGSPGNMSYHSLMTGLDSNVLEFGNVWQMIEFRDQVLIRGGSAIFSWQQDSLSVLIAGKLYDYITVVQDKIYATVVNEGLGIIDKGVFTLLPFGETFAQTNVKGLFPLDNELIIFTDDQGIFLTSDDGVRKIERIEHNRFVEDQISTVLLLKNGNFAVGTVRNGLFIIDRKGNTLQHINKQSGLQNNTIISMVEDTQGNLWLGLDNGISYIELNTCLTKLNAESDIGTGYVSILHNEKLYLGTNQGLFYINWAENTDSFPSKLEIVPVKGTSGQVWNLNMVGNKLYCGHHKGLFKVDDDIATLVDQNRGSWQLDSIRGYPGFYVESTYRGFFILKENDRGKLQNLGKLQGLPAIDRIFIQDLDGYFWIVSSEYKIYRFRIDPVSLHVVDLESLSDRYGFNESGIIRLVGNPRQVFFSTKNGIFQFDPLDKKFTSNEYYNQIIGPNQTCFEFFEDDYNRIWYVTANEIGYFSLHFGQPEKVTLPFTRLFDSYTRTFGKIGVLDEDNILFAVDEGYYHFPYRCRENSPSSNNAFIIDLETHDAPIDFRENNGDDTGTIPIYRHNQSAFSFTFTSNIFHDPEKVMYRYRLLGLEEGWSDWTTRNIKEYNNLFEGKYQFQVVSRNKYNEESDVATYSFIVKPPGYRSPLAIFFYSLLIVGAIIVLRLIRNRKMEREVQLLEKQKQNEIEKKQQEYEAEQLKAKQHIIALQKEKLEQDLLFKSKELSNAAYNLLQKNEMLQKLRDEMKVIFHEKDVSKRDKIIQRLMRMIGREINTKKDLEVFDLHFNVVHEDFIEKLREKFPDLNQNDQRICIFLKMNKSTKEIATLMNMSVRGVETSRYRIRKKMGLKRSDNLFEVISRM